MTGKRISELAEVAAPLTLRELLPAVQEGVTTRISVERLRGGRIVSIRDFGAVGDGVADDTAAFQAMHAQLIEEQRLDPDLRAVIMLPPGVYRYTWNRWLWGLRRVTVDGYGARLQCVNASKWNFLSYPLVTNRNGFQTMAADQDAQPKTSNAGYLIETADPGANTVRLKMARDAAKLTPGKYVLVMSYDQQFAGFPPNCRYFDYAVVAAVNGSTVTLDRPLRHYHRDDYPEIGEGSAGRARIVDIDRDDVPFAIEQTLLGVTILRNPNLEEDSVQYLLAQGVYSFRARDCDLISFIPSIGHDFTVETSAIVFSEPDKLIDTVSFANCRIGALTQATGVNVLAVANCTVASKASAQARVMSFSGCTFEGATQPGDYQRGVDLVGFAPTRAVSIVNSAFYGKNGADDNCIAPVGTPSNVFTNFPLTAPIRIDDNRTLAIPLSDKRAQTLLSSADIGDTVLVGAQFGSDVYCDGRFGVVKAIRAEHDDVVCEIAFSAAVMPEDILIVPRAQSLFCMGNSYSNVMTRVPVTCNTTFENAVANSESFTISGTSDFAAETRYVYGVLRAVAVNVLKPYTGPDPAAFLRIERHFPVKATLNQTIDLRQKGRRRIAVSGISGQKPEDVLAELAVDEFLWSLRLSHGATPNGADAVPSGTHDQLATYIVRFETENLFRRFN